MNAPPITTTFPGASAVGTMNALAIATTYAPWILLVVGIVVGFIGNNRTGVVQIALATISAGVGLLGAKAL
jgi:hypothetical protein